MKKMTKYSNKFTKRIDKKVNRLRSLSNEKNKDKEKFVKILKEINNEILNCKIVVGKKKIIYPIWVEAYYNDFNQFRDNSCHKKKGTKNKLRVHSKGRGGIDLYIGDESDNYYLSILIKLSFIKGINSKKNSPRTLVSQTELKEKLKDINNKELDFQETDLDLEDVNIIATKRVRITNRFKKCDLAMYLSPKTFNYDNLRDNNIYYRFKNDK